MHRYYGYLHRRWKVFFAAGHLHYKKYDFHVEYRKGCRNDNADALSRVMHPGHSYDFSCWSMGENKEEMRLAQQQDTVLDQVLVALQTPSVNPKNTTLRREQPLLRYGQIWPQLVLVDGVACRKYKPGPCGEAIEVPLIPKTRYKPRGLYIGLSSSR